MIEVQNEVGGKSIFWTGGVEAEGAETVEPIETEDYVNKEGNDVKVVTKRKTGTFKGKGRLRVVLLAYHWMGIDLQTKDKAMTASFGDSW